MEVDGASWTASAPPRELVRLKKVRSVDMLSVLLHTAAWTRPPEVHGFDLSDCWAWTRYAAAISASPKLRLRQEWTSLNAHHKAVLSDDFGVGLSTYLLCRAFRVIEFVDASYALNVRFPGRFGVGHRSRRGPSKLPDYVARLRGGGFAVLECKGTQSDGHLDKAMSSGFPQKRNLHARLGTRIRASLVGGAFIPQWDSAEEARVVFADPEWEEFAEAMLDVSDEDLELAIVQIAAAKQFALAGAFQAADLLARMPLVDTVHRGLEADLSDDSISAFRISRPIQLNDESVEKDGRAIRRGQTVLRSIGFTADVRPLAAVFRESRTVRDAIRTLAARSRQQPWRHRCAKDGRSASIVTPYGVSLALDL